MRLTYPFKEWLILSSIFAFQLVHFFIELRFDLDHLKLKFLEGLKPPLDNFGQAEIM